MASLHRTASTTFASRPQPPRRRASSLLLMLLLLGAVATRGAHASVPAVSPWATIALLSSSLAASSSPGPSGTEAFSSSVAVVVPQRRRRFDPRPRRAGPFLRATSRPSSLSTAAPPAPNSRLVKEGGRSAGRNGPEDDEDNQDDDDDDDCLFPHLDDASGLMMRNRQLQSPALVRGTPLEDSDRERNRQGVRAIKTLLFDSLFRPEHDDKDDTNADLQLSYRRFHALETIARTPYFAYASALHLLETIGKWRQADFLKLHFCEAWNELHHLLVLEELLGGNVPFRDRFVAQHAAVAYYWFAVVAYLFNPAFAYNLNQAVEEEAYETYDNFLGRHSERLKALPAPGVAVRYYTGADLYLFDSMHHTTGSGSALSSSAAALASAPPRRPKCETLYDTFVNIRDDEMEHVKTMAYLQGECQPAHDPLPSPQALIGPDVAPATLPSKAATRVHVAPA